VPVQTPRIIPGALKISWVSFLKMLIFLKKVCDSMGKNISRKQFLAVIPVLSSLSGVKGLVHKKQSLKLSFSTLGCPDWSLDQIISFADSNGYSGIEIRGIKRQMYLPHVPEFSDLSQISVTLQKMKDHDLKFVDLGSSAAMHFPDGITRNQNLGEAKNFIDLASKLNCPYVRVFPNELPAERSKEESLKFIIEGLRDLGEYAANKNVTVLLESHGKLIYKDDLYQVMRNVGHPQVGMVWDICNMWVATKEPPREVYALLKPYIKHTHIKDMSLANGKEEYVLLGKGEVPIFEAINILRRNRYSGYYSFEWEKLWHPEIQEPEIALSDFPLAMEQNALK
jgi:sugar phosphate isomerase/epimerase